MAMNRKREILRRATEVFEHQGVARTSMEDIANAVGIKREGIYYYFKSRGDILLEIILPQSNSLVLGLRRIMDSRMSRVEKLHAAIQSHLDAFNPAYLEMSVALREDHFVRDDKKLRELKRIWDTYGALWTELIAEGQEEAVFKPGLDPKLVAFGLLGMCNWVSRWYDPNKGDISISDVIETFSTMAATGILVPDDVSPGAAS